MENTANQTMSRTTYRALAVTTVVFALALPLIVGVVAQAISAFGRSANIDLYMTFAEISPVLALATFVDQAVLVTTRLSDVTSNPETFRLIAGNTIRVQTALLVLLEAMAFYAIGAQVTTTFLLVCCLATLLIQVVSLANLSLGRAGLKQVPADPPSVKDPKKQSA
jgi:hypothetical protein